MSARGSNFGTCCYADCPNSHTGNSNSTFFKFPTDDTRRKKWIKNCGNPAIADLSDRQLRGKRICALHFADSSFSLLSKEVLSDKAIPLKCTKTAETASTTPTETPTPAKRQGRSLVQKDEKQEVEEKLSEPAKKPVTRNPTKVQEKVPEISEPAKKPVTRNPTKVQEKVPEISEPAKKPVTRSPTKVQEKVPEILEPVKKPVTRSPAKVQEKVPETPKTVKPVPAVVDKEVKHFQQRSKFGKALYAFIDELLSEEEPMVKREKKSAGKPLQFSSQLENKSLLRTANGHSLIKTEGMDTAYSRVIRSQKPILPAHMKRGSGVEQFITLGNDPGNLIVQNGGQFTLAEGQEYEVIGESDGNNQIQVVESENNEIEIIEVDDQTMAQLTAQNMFFNSNSGSIQVSELDPNMGQILRVINPSSEQFYQSQ